jgi:hypothetical protein
MWGKLKQWVTWKIAGPKVEKFINLNCNALLEEFPDLKYIEFEYKGKKFRFEQSTKETDK